MTFLEYSDRALTIDAQRRKVFGNGFPNCFSHNVWIIVAEPIAEAAYIVQG